MFNIKSKVEYDNSNKIIYKNKDYNPEVMGYVCPCCHKKIKCLDFLGKLPDSKIKEKLSEKKISLQQRKEIGYCTFIQKYDTTCINCNAPIDAEILIEMEEDEILNYEIIASDSLEFSLDSFLVMGIDIYSHCQLLFLRWWRDNRDIDVVVPFITKEYFQLFFDLLKITYGYKSFLSDDNVSLNNNPFNKLVFRKKQNKTSTLKEVFNDWASCNIKSVSNNLNSLTIYEDIIDNIYDCLYQVENTPNYCYKTEDNVENLNLALMYERYFHAKYFAGVNKNNTELFITSYNFGDIEGLQYETQCINIIDTEEYKRVFDIFKNYPRITFSKV